MFDIFFCFFFICLFNEQKASIFIEDIWKYSFIINKAWHLSSSSSRLNPVSSYYYYLHMKLNIQNNIFLSMAIYAVMNHFFKNKYFHIFLYTLIIYHDISHPVPQHLKVQILCVEWGAFKLSAVNCNIWPGYIYFQATTATPGYLWLSEEICTSFIFEFNERAPGK